MRLRVIAGYAAGKYTVSPEGMARRIMAVRESNRRREPSPEGIKRRSDARRGVKRNTPATAIGPQHARSLEGVLRDPSGRIWSFINLHHFVRTHHELFNEEDLRYKPQCKRSPLQLACNAQKRLGELFGRGRHVPGSWKGWTVGDSIIERRDGLKDPLDRIS